MTSRVLDEFEVPTDASGNFKAKCNHCATSISGKFCEFFDFCELKCNWKILQCNWKCLITFLSNWTQPWHSLRNMIEKLAKGSLFYQFLKLVQINYIFSDNVQILYISETQDNIMKEVNVYLFSYIKDHWMVIYQFYADCKPKMAISVEQSLTLKPMWKKTENLFRIKMIDQLLCSLHCLKPKTQSTQVFMLLKR